MLTWSIVNNRVHSLFFLRIWRFTYICYVYRNQISDPKPGPQRKENQQYETYHYTVLYSLMSAFNLVNELILSKYNFDQTPSTKLFIFTFMYMYKHTVSCFHKLWVLQKNWYPAGLNLHIFKFENLPILSQVAQINFVHMSTTYCISRALSPNYIEPFLKL